MTDLFPLLLFTFATALTPGPNNILLMNSGLHFGLRKSMSHYFGICFGFPAMTLIVALGFGAIFLHHEWLKHVLRILGSVYMLYLAYQTLTADSSLTISIEKKPWRFIQALLFQWINPKAWLMAIGAISIFTITQNYLMNALAISSIFLLFCLPCLGIWLGFGVVLQKILKEEKHRRWFNAFMAFCLVASIVMIFVD